MGKLDRRELLRLGLLGGAGWISGAPVFGDDGGSHSMHASSRAWTSTKRSQEVQKPKSLMPYVDALPTPMAIRPANSNSVLQIRAREFYGKVHRDLPPTRLWGYYGMWPGPTIEVRRGQALAVKWLNELPKRHFLPISPSIHGSEEGVPEVRTVVHVHGAQVLPESDGYPEAWITADGKTGPTYDAAPSHYPNDQSATSLWYHDHALGITRLNVVAGLAGVYLI